MKKITSVLSKLKLIHVGVVLMIIGFIMMVPMGWISAIKGDKFVTDTILWIAIGGIPSMVFGFAIYVDAKEFCN